MLGVAKGTHVSHTNCSLHSFQKLVAQDTSLHSPPGYSVKKNTVVKYFDFSLGDSNAFFSKFIELVDEKQEHWEEISLT